MNTIEVIIANKSTRRQRLADLCGRQFTQMNKLRRLKARANDKSHTSDADKANRQKVRTCHTLDVTQASVGPKSLSPVSYLGCHLRAANHTLLGHFPSPSNARALTGSSKDEGDVTLRGRHGEGRHITSVTSHSEERMASAPCGPVVTS